MKKHTIKYIKKEIRKRGGTLISEKYINNKHPIFVRCRYNHIWKTRFNNIVSGNWCPICSSNYYTVEKVRKIIAKKKGKLLSSYKNTKTKLKTKCLKCKSVWHPTFENILKGKWCPKCSGGKSQKRLFDILKQIYPNCEVRLNYRNFEWLKNQKTGGIQEIDIFVYNRNKSFTLAVEYDGEHHFFPVRFGGISEARAKEKFKNTKKRDKRKNRLIKQNSNDIKYFIRIKYIIDLNIDNIRLELNRKNIPINNLNGGDE